MDLQQISEYFDGTIFQDDYRVNLDQADRRIKALETLNKNGPSSDIEASILLIRIVRAAICGNYSVADRQLSKLQTLAETASNISLLERIPVYRLYLRSLKRLSPCLRFRDDRDSPEGAVKAIVHADHAEQQEVQNKTRLETPPMLVIFESRLIQQYSRVYYHIWTEALPQNTPYHSGSVRTSFDEDKSFARDLRCHTGSMNTPHIVSYLGRLDLEYLVAGRSSNVRSKLTSFHDSSYAKDDLVNAAHCKLLEGDSILSPPFTSALALNLIAVSHELGWCNERWDDKEHEFPLMENPDGLECYQLSHKLFAQAGSKRGQAAVSLRYACICLAKAIRQTRTDDSPTFKESLERALDNLAQARQMFRGDITNILIVSVHSVIHGILSEDYAGCLERAYDTGLLGRISGNIGTAQFCGVLLLRLGRSLAEHVSGIKRALVCCKCAKVCFRTLNDPFLELHAVVAAAKLHQREGDIPSAAKNIQYGRKLLPSVQDYFANLREEKEKAGNLMTLKQLQTDLAALDAQRVFCLSAFDHVASTVYETDQAQSTDLAQSSEKDFGGSKLSALLGSLNLDGLDPAFVELQAALLTASDSLHDLRKEYRQALQAYRDEMTMQADIDKAEVFLKNVLERFDTFAFSGGSVEINIWRLVIFDCLGEYDRAQEILADMLPTKFGGNRPLMEYGEDEENPSPELTQKIKEINEKNAAMSLSYCFLSKHWQAGMIVLSVMTNANADIFENIVTSDDPDKWYHIVWMANILEHNDQLWMAFSLYTLAFRLVEARRQRLTDIRDRREIYSSTNSSELFLGLARIALRFAEAPSDYEMAEGMENWALSSCGWKDQAVRFLELGRSRMLLDLLLAERLVPPDSLRKWSHGSHELRSQEANFREAIRSVSNDSGVPQHPTKPEKRTEYLSRIYAELSDELFKENVLDLLPDAELITTEQTRLYECIPANAIVVHITTGRDALLILCIDNTGIVFTHLTATTSLDVSRNVHRLIKLLFQVESWDASHLPAPDVCDSFIYHISDTIIAPIKHILIPREHIIFIPSGSLNKFPLSALQLDGGPLFCSKDVSQVPSLSSLHYITDEPQRATSKTSIIVKDLEKRGLDVSTSACFDIAIRQGTRPHLANELDHNSFSELYEQSEVVLIGTHGHQHDKSAWESSILLLEPALRVLDLTKLHSSASLVIFEACVSGIGESTPGNDVLGFTHAVLASGVSAFLGSLWPVSDAASALLMSFLFEELADRRHTKSLARCLRNAQRRLYRLDRNGALEIFEHFQNACTSAQTIGVIKKSQARRLRTAIEYMIESMKADAVDFKHVYIYAPFVLAGNGSLTLG